MLFAELAEASERVAATTKRGEKAALLADVLRRLRPTRSTAPSGSSPACRGRAASASAGPRCATCEAAPAAEPSLTVLDVDRAIDRLAAMGGSGVDAARRALLADLFARATAPEQRLLSAVLGGELRQGALDGVMVDAVAKAAGVPMASVRRAHMFSGELGAGRAAALRGGEEELRAVGMVPGRAVQPMLASPAADLGDGAGGDRPGVGRVEARRRPDPGPPPRRRGPPLHPQPQRHHGPAGVGRRAVAGLPGGDLVLDGEVLGVDDEGAPRRFQDTMGDFGADAAERAGAGLSASFFDVLHAGGEAVVDEPLAVRRELLATIVPAARRLPSIVTADADEAAAFLDRAIAAGHEGVMVKGLDTLYDAGRRGGAWRKIKPVHTLDLVVLAAEWGHGRRTGWLSNLHLGARGDDGFVMVGKTFKGLTDELLRWQTDALQPIAVGTEDGYVVHVRPELVVEIALDGVQASTRYPGGVALRFARVRRYRPDKRPAEADHIATVQAMLS